MSYWDGSRWIPETVSTPAPRPRRLNDWAATAVMIVGLVALIAPLQLIAAASHRKADPGLTASCGASVCTVGGSLTVSGSGFTPSAGGQQVILWVGYADDYCVGTTCHGFYVDPWVASDGTFSATFSGVLLQAGTGQVKAIEYLPRPGRWDNVAQADYTVQ
jgi:hypothetical protein